MKSPIFKVVLEREKRFGVDVSDISVYICLIDIRSKSKEQLNERRAGLSNIPPFPPKLTDYVQKPLYNFNRKNIPQSWTVYVHCTVQCAVCAVTSVVNFATPTFFQSPICLGSILSHQKPNLPGLICRGFIKKSITWWSKKVMQKKCRSSKFDLSISSGCRRGGFFRCKAAHPRCARVYCLVPEKESPL